ncbi:NAD(P)/FAD-dependent oxidoreductase [Maridesulfovibrio sp.]|uniref:NAD(P)/FAD-dependent oxidoreductase n=1 Tax=Maridesulfovibrio sp. TaxID=2795000 RepID=UPI0039F07D49
MAAKQLVLIGGGHAHMVTLSKISSFIDKGYGVTVVQPSDYHYYSGMGPGMLGGTYQPDDIRFHTRKVVEDQGAKFIKDKVRLIDPEHQVVILENSAQEIAYDVLSCNAGSYVPKNKIVKTKNIYAAKPIEGLIQAREELIRRGKNEPLTVAVVGGGPSSLEIAGNIWQMAQQEKLKSCTVRIFAGHRLMRNYPEKIGVLARNIFQKRGIEIIEGSYVEEIGKERIILQDGRSFTADLIFPAIGVKPSKIFTESKLPTGPDGGLLVNKFLQSTKYKNIFGGGDCIYFEPHPLDKVGVYAVRENHVLYNNLMAALEGRELEQFDPGGKYLLIYNLGGDIGILCKWSIIFSGKLAFKIKDYIDRKFIRTFKI